MNWSKTFLCNCHTFNGSRGWEKEEVWRRWKGMKLSVFCIHFHWRVKGELHWRDNLCYTFIRDSYIWLISYFRFNFNIYWGNFFKYMYVVFEIDLKEQKAISIKCFVSHCPPSLESGSVGRTKKKKKKKKGGKRKKGEQRVWLSIRRPRFNPLPG